jgi:hypothetical protein
MSPEAGQDVGGAEARWLIKRGLVEPDAHQSHGGLIELAVRTRSSTSVRLVGSGRRERAAKP